MLTLEFSSVQPHRATTMTVDSSLVSVNQLTTTSISPRLIWLTSPFLIPPTKNWLAWLFFHPGKKPSASTTPDYLNQCKNPNFVAIHGSGTRLYSSETCKTNQWSEKSTYSSIWWIVILMSGGSSTSLTSKRMWIKSFTDINRVPFTGTVPATRLFSQSVWSPLVLPGWAVWVSSTDEQHTNWVRGKIGHSGK